jgi:hypothetical protein
MHEQISRFESEVTAQTLVLETMKMNCDEAVRGNTDSHQRAQSLAQVM